MGVDRGHWLTLLFCADFWGPASNFGIPIAAVMDTQKDPEMYVDVLSPATLMRAAALHCCVATKSSLPHWKKPWLTWYHL